MSSKAGLQPTETFYTVGIIFLLAKVLDKVTSIEFDEKVAWSGDAEDQDRIYIDAPNLFGGDNREAGITGFVKFLFGKENQGENGYIKTYLRNGNPIPHFLGSALAVFQKVDFGPNYYLKSPRFMSQNVYTRQDGTPQWRQDLIEPIPNHINAVHVIRDCLTSILKHPETLIHEESFVASAQKCFDEGLGFGFFWDGKGKVDDFLTDVESHIQASLYVNRTDGLFHLDLTRLIIDTSNLIELNQANSGSVTNYKKKSTHELVNQVTVKFLNNKTRKDEAYTDYDTALIQRQGKIVPKDITYSGCTSMQMAQRLCTRDLQQLGLSLRTGTIECTRVAENLHKGQAFVINRPDIEKSKITCRVVTIDVGTEDDGKIIIDFIQDFFHAADVIYDVPEDSDWVDPISDPVPVQLMLLNEMPYYLIATKKGDEFAQNVPDYVSYLDVAAVSPLSISSSAGLWTGASANKENLTRHGIVDFCFSAILVFPINRIETTIVLSDIVKIKHLSLNKFVQLGNELVQVTNIIEVDENTYNLTIVRGVLDTIPVDHLADERIYGWHDFSASDEIAYAIGETTYVSLTTITPKGELTLSDSTHSLIFDGRLHKPYPPGNLQINDLYWPTSVASGVVELTWAHRNRFLQTANLVNYYSSDISSELDVNYAFELRKTIDNSLISSATAISNNFYNINTTYIGNVNLKLWSYKTGTGLKSFQEINFTFNLT